MSVIGLRETPLSFDDSLPVLELKIPLKYSEDDDDNYSSLKPDERFQLNLTKQGQILPLADSIITSISYRVLNDSKTVVLTPLILNNNLNLKFQKLKILLPETVVNNCLVINQDVANDCIIVDLLMITNVLVSLKFNYTDFLINESVGGSNELSIERFKHWGKCSIPYDFSARSAHLIKAISHQNLVVSLEDGGLVHLRRENFYDDFEIFSFNDSSYFRFNLFAKVDKIIGHENVSVKTVIDLVAYNNLLITLSINKILKVWSLETHNILLEKNLNQFVPNEYDKIFLHVNRMKCLDIIESDGLVYLTTLLSIGNGFFNVWEFNHTRVTLEDTSFKFNPQLPDKSSIWLIQDYKVSSSIPNLKYESKFNIWFLWKSNTSSIIQHLSINNANQIVTYKTESNEIISTSLFHINNGLNHDQTHSEFYVDKIFNQDIYSDLIIDTSLQVFDIFYNNENTIEDLNFMKRDKVLAIINKAIDNNGNYNKSVSNQWKRFDSLCSEFKKLGSEPISMSLDFTTGFIYLLKGLNYSVVRNCTNYEILYLNQDTMVDSILPDVGTTYTNDIKSFLLLLNNFRSKLSNRTLSNLSIALMNDYCNNSNHNSTTIQERINSIYDSVLSEKCNSEMLNEFLSNLGTIPNVMECINYLTQVGQIDASHIFQGSKLGGFGTYILIDSLQQIIEIHSNIIFEILILTLIVEANEEIINIYNKLSKIFINYKLFNEISKISFNPQNKIEADNLSKSINSLLYKILVKIHGENFELNSLNFNSIFNQVFHLINDENFIYYIISELISLNYSEIIKNKFFNYLPPTPISEFLIGLTYYTNNESHKFYKQFNKDPSQIIGYEIQNKDLISLTSIDSKFLVLFNTDKVRYYHNLSNLAKDRKMIDIALKFEIKAIEHNQLTQVFKIDELHLNVFQLSLECCDFELAYNSLMNLSPIEIKSENKEEELPQYDYNSLVTEFMQKLFLAGDIKKLVTYPFISHISIVDKILLRLASHELVLKTSLNYYKVLYSWRLTHGESRGACEALYMFITRFDNEEIYTQKTDNSMELSIEDKIKNFEIKKINLIIAELYIIILNLLSTFCQDEDKWILRYDSEKNEVLNYKMIQNEYNNWLNKLEMELVGN